MITDKLDLEILRMLSENARKPYLEIARDLGMSGAAVHQRVQRLVANKVILGSECIIAPSEVGYEVVAYLGVNVLPGTDIDTMIESLLEIPNICECHVVAGRFDIIAKMYARDNKHMLEIIQDQVLHLNVASTETMVSFRQAFRRPIPVEVQK